jgi:hypothetical protein
MEYLKIANTADSLTLHETSNKTNLLYQKATHIFNNRKEEDKIEVKTV